ISNFLLPELRAAREAKADHLLFLGTHAVIQTVGQSIFGLEGLAATSFYLKHFVDGDAPDTTFSLIAEDLHDMRNVIAHQWFSRPLHDVAITYAIPEGWKAVGDTIHINPDIYAGRFLSGFEAGGSIWDYDVLVTDEVLCVRRLEYAARLMKLGRKHPLRVRIA